MLTRARTWFLFLLLINCWCISSTCKVFVLWLPKTNMPFVCLFLYITVDETPQMSARTLQSAAWMHSSTRLNSPASPQFSEDLIPQPWAPATRTGDLPAASPLLCNFFRWISWFGGEQILAASTKGTEEGNFRLCTCENASFHPHSSLVVGLETSMLEVTFHQYFGVSAPLVTHGQVWSHPADPSRAGFLLPGSFQHLWIPFTPRCF